MASAATALPPPSPTTADDVWRSRRQRTVRVTLDPAGRPYGRADFVRQVHDTVGLPSLEAVGPTQESNVWELTFSCQMKATQYVAGGDFNVRGFRAAVQAADNQCYRVRLHWVPYYVPHDVFVTAFESKGAKVVAADFDKSAVKGMEHVCSGLRTYTLRTSHPGDIPHLIPFTSGHEQREALVTMTGRLPLCLRCRTSGHVRQQCKVPFCWRCKTYGHRKQDCPGRTYASAADPRRGTDPSNQPDEEEEDEEDTVEERRDDRPTEDNVDGQRKETTLTDGKDTNTEEPPPVDNTTEPEPPPRDDTQPADDPIGSISDDEMDRSIENEIPPSWDDLVIIHEKQEKLKSSGETISQEKNTTNFPDDDIRDMELGAPGLQSSIARRKRSGASLSESENSMSPASVAESVARTEASWSTVRDNKRVRTPGTNLAAVKHNLPVQAPVRTKTAELTASAFKKKEKETTPQPRREKESSNRTKEKNPTRN